MYGYGKGDKWGGVPSSVRAHWPTWTGEERYSNLVRLLTMVGKEIKCSATENTMNMSCHVRSKLYVCVLHICLLCLIASLSILYTYIL